jgi:hypothetical protein
MTIPTNTHTFVAPFVDRSVARTLEKPFMDVVYATSIHYDQIFLDSITTAYNIQKPLWNLTRRIIPPVMTKS